MSESKSQKRKNAKTQKRKNKRKYKQIPVELSNKGFNAFALPHLSISTLGRKPKISLFKLFNYIMYVLHTGCQWSSLKKVFAKNRDGKCEINCVLPNPT